MVKARGRQSNVQRALLLAEDARTNETSDGSGAMRLRRTFTTAGEYCFEVYANETAREPLRTEALGAVKPEMYALRPFKGDLHLHTMALDGKDTAAAMAAALAEYACFLHREYFSAHGGPVNETEWGARCREFWHSPSA